MAKHHSQDEAQQLLQAAFSIPRDPRSDAYKAGVLATLELRCNGVPIIRPYRVGTAECDAFSAGVDEGRAIWRQAQGGAS